MAAAIASGSLALHLLRALRAGALEPRLLKTLLVLGAPLRLAVAANLWAGRSLKSLAAELARRLLELAGWLAGRVEHRGRLRLLARWERAYFGVRRWHVALATLVLAKGAQWAARRWAEWSSGARQKRKQLQQRLQTASSYADWAAAAQELEGMRGLDSRTRWLLETQFYDRRLLQERLQYLRRVREGGDVAEVMFALRSDLIRNLGNMTSSALHEHFPVVPDLIREYIQEVQADLQYVTSSPDMPLDEKLAFLRESRHAFGRTALVLSGGGSFGAFHMGIVKALLDANLLPRVVSGSSAGSIVSAILCTRSEAELQEVFDSLAEGLGGIEFYSFNTLGQILRHVLLKGTLQDHTVLQDRLRRILGDMTFAEAYQRSGRILNVSVSAADTSEPPRLLNYLTAPNVLVWSAVACSSAFPFLYVPQQLLARDSRGQVVGFNAQAAGELQRRWRDGSLEEDLPMRGLSELFNVNFFLVSQANPYVLPLMALKRMAPWKLGSLVEGELKHRCKQLMEVLPAWVGANRLLKLVNQPWEGDLTMVLPVSTFSAAKSVINLSKEDLLLALDEGKRATWGKLSAIQANCAIEATIDECLRQVTVFANAARRRAARRSSRAAAVTVAANGTEATVLRRGIPSWLHMPALGIMPRSESREGVGTPRGGNGYLDSPRAPSLGAGLDQYQYQYQYQYQVTPDAVLLSHPAALGASRNPLHNQSNGALLQMAVQETLTDTVVPEEADGEEQQEAAAAGPADGGLQLTEDGGAAWGAPPSPSLESGRQLWADFFSVAPATTAAAASTSLDFIAP